MMKMTVLYHSVTGNTKTMAQVIAEGMIIPSCRWFCCMVYDYAINRIIRWR